MHDSRSQGSKLAYARGQERCGFGRGRRSRRELRATGLGAVYGYGRRCSFIVSPPIWCRWSRPLARPSEESCGSAAVVCRPLGRRLLASVLARVDADAGSAVRQTSRPPLASVAVEPASMLVWVPAGFPSPTLPKAAKIRGAGARSAAGFWRRWHIESASMLAWVTARFSSPTLPQAAYRPA